MTAGPTGERIPGHRTPTPWIAKARLNLLVICRSKARMGKVDLEFANQKISASLWALQGIFNPEVISCRSLTFGDAPSQVK